MKLKEYKQVLFLQLWCDIRNKKSELPSHTTSDTSITSTAKIQKSDFIKTSN